MSSSSAVERTQAQAQAQAQVQALGTGVLLLREFIPKAKAAEIVRYALQCDGWVQSASGTYEANELVEQDFSAKQGVFTIRQLALNTWSHQPSWDLLRDLIHHTWNIQISRFSDFGLSRYDVNASIDEHQDTGPYNTPRVVTFVLYLNDQFSGGEIVFPRLGIRHKPGCGDLLVFLSEHIHRVDRLIEGQRFCLIWFGEVAPEMFQL